MNVTCASANNPSWVKISTRSCLARFPIALVATAFAAGPCGRTTGLLLPHRQRTIKTLRLPRRGRKSGHIACVTKPFQPRRLAAGLQPLAEDDLNRIHGAAA
jgi:hypothetical protein